MGEFLSYAVVSGLLMFALYPAYRVFLARDNQHGFNRMVLLLIYAVSFTALPCCRFWESLTVTPGAQIVAFTGEAFSGVITTAPEQPVWCTVVLWMYLAGMAVVAARTLATWVRLTRVIRAGEKIRAGSYTLVVTDDDKYAPFSWLRYVVISRADYENERAAIVAHELKHVASRHWIDLLVAQAVCIIEWFNPVAWLLRDELMLVHEYQADMAVIDSGHDAKEYQMLLIKKAVGVRFPSLANSLNHSKLKKRITMMYKAKSGAGRKFKALALVPAVALAFGVADVPAVRAAVSTIGGSSISFGKTDAGGTLPGLSETAGTQPAFGRDGAGLTPAGQLEKAEDRPIFGKGNENKPKDKITVQRFKVTNINHDGKETTVVIRGEGLGDKLTVAGGTFTNRGKTYEATSLRCGMTDGVATITAVFPFAEEYKRPKMTLIVNEVEIPFDLDHFFEKSQSVVVGNKQDMAAKGTIVIGGSTSSVPEDMEIYLDGKKIPTAELKDVLPDKIASVVVDKQRKTIRITTDGDATPVACDAAVAENMDIYLDGKKVVSSVFREISPDKIASITFDKKQKAVRITLKK